MSWGETLFLKKVIDGKRTLRASDNCLVNYIDVKGSSLRENVEIGTFTPKTSGQVKLSGIIACRNSVYPLYINVYLEDLQVASLIPRTTDSLALTGVTFAVEKNKTYTIKTVALYEAGGVVLCDNLSICADIVDGSLFDYNIVGV